MHELQGYWTMAAVKRALPPTTENEEKVSFLMVLMSLLSILLIPLPRPLLVPVLCCVY